MNFTQIFTDNSNISGITTTPMAIEVVTQEAWKATIISSFQYTRAFLLLSSIPYVWLVVTLLVRLKQ